MTRLSVVPWSSGGWGGGSGWGLIPYPTKPCYYRNQKQTKFTLSREHCRPSSQEVKTVAANRDKWRDSVKALSKYGVYVQQGTKRIGEVRWSNVMCLVPQKWAETNKLNEHNSSGKNPNWPWTNQLIYKRDKWAEHAANKNIFNIFNLGSPHRKSSVLNTQPCYLIKGQWRYLYVIFIDFSLIFQVTSVTH